MKEKTRFTLSALMWSVILLAVYPLTAHAQTGPNNHQPAARKGATTQAIGPALPVLGGGTVGQLTKWTGFTSSNSVIGDSNISEDKLVRCRPCNFSATVRWPFYFKT